MRLKPGKRRRSPVERKAANNPQGNPYMLAVAAVKIINQGRM